MLCAIYDIHSVIDRNLYRENKVIFILNIFFFIFTSFFRLKIVLKWKLLSAIDILWMWFSYWKIFRQTFHKTANQMDRKISKMFRHHNQIKFEAMIFFFFKYWTIDKPIRWIGNILYDLPNQFVINNKRESIVYFHWSHTFMIRLTWGTAHICLLFYLHSYLGTWIVFKVNPLNRGINMIATELKKRSHQKCNLFKW